MSRHLTILIGLVIVALGGGCRRDKPTPAGPGSTGACGPCGGKIFSSRSTAAPPVIAPPAEASTKPALAASTGEKGQGQSPEQQPKSADAPLALSAINEDHAASSTKASTLRVALLTPGGPLTMDVTLTIDGHPHNDTFEKLLAGVLEAADTDQDKQATWKELAANEEFLKQQADSSSPARARDLKTWTDQFDRNRDGQIQPDEAAAWLGRTAGRKARAFEVRSSRSYSSVPLASSRIWKLLDADGDGQLSGDELAHCANSLVAFDDDDEGTITSSEIVSLREQLGSSTARSAAAARGGSPFAAIFLEPGFAVDRLEYLLTDLYAPRQNLQPASFPGLAMQYQQLDANNDGVLEQDELARLLTIEPHLKLAVEFTMANEKGAGVASLTVVEHIPELTVVAQPASDRAVLTLGTTRLVIVAQDLAAAPQPAQAIAASQTRLMVHDQCDAVGELLDADSDGRLGEREIYSSSNTLLKYDADHDGQLQGSELPYSMIVAFLRGERDAEDSFYRPQSDAARTSFASAPAWFIRTDFNGDGDISRREFLGTTEQFSRLDLDHDSFVSAAEATPPETTNADSPTR